MAKGASGPGGGPKGPSASDPTGNDRQVKQMQRTVQAVTFPSGRKDAASPTRPTTSTWLQEAADFRRQEHIRRFGRYRAPAVQARANQPAAPGVAVETNAPSALRVTTSRIDQSALVNTLPATTKTPAVAQPSVAAQPANPVQPSAPAATPTPTPAQAAPVAAASSGARSVSVSLNPARAEIAASLAQSATTAEAAPSNVAAQGTTARRYHVQQLPKKLTDKAKGVGVGDD